MNEKPNLVWLLEIVKSDLSQETMYYKSYGRPIDGGRDDLHVTNPDPIQAKQFASEQEANAYAEEYGLSDQLVAQEHMFNCASDKENT